MTTPQQRAVFHRTDLTITVHDVDSDGRPTGTPPQAVTFVNDLDAALAGAEFVRVGPWHRRAGRAADLVADVVAA
jgi:hypothetical protein